MYDEEELDEFIKEMYEEEKRIKKMLEEEQTPRDNSPVETPKTTLEDGNEPGIIAYGHFKEYWVQTEEYEMRLDLSIGDIKVEGQQSLYGQTIYIRKNGKFMLQIDDTSTLFDEYNWDSNPLMSKEEIIKIVLEESVKLNFKLYIEVHKQKVAPALTGLLNSKDRDCDQDTPPDFTLRNVNETLEQIKNHPEYERFTGLHLRTIGTVVSLISEDIWTPQKGEIKVCTEYPQLDWITNLFYRTSIYDRNTEQERLVKLLGSGDSESNL